MIFHDGPLPLYIMPIMDPSVGELVGAVVWGWTLAMGGLWISVLAFIIGKSPRLHKKPPRKLGSPDA